VEGLKEKWDAEYHAERADALQRQLAFPLGENPSKLDKQSKSAFSDCHKTGRWLDLLVQS
jgi:hypothetical protein